MLSSNLRDCGVLGSLRTADVFPVVASLPPAGETRNLSRKNRMLSQAKFLTSKFSTSTFARKPVLWVVSHVTKTSLVVKEKQAHA